MIALSCGGGVQSSTVALMAAHGEFGIMPDLAGFADTKDESKATYRWLDWLETQLPFPLHRVSAGSLSKRSLQMVETEDGRLYSKTDIPVFTKSVEDGSQGKIRQRSCTRDFKIVPLNRLYRQQAAVKRGQKTPSVEVWIGISLDEVTRMKPSRELWSVNRWPLIEKRMTRHDCLRWLDKHGYPHPPRSACKYCPFHSDREWRNLRDSDPTGFNEAVEFERELQRVKSKSTNFSSIPFLHRSLVPLDQVDFSTAEERGQINMFENECEGMCGV